MTRIRIPRQVGIVVMASRKGRGLTQSQVADAAGVSRQLVNRLETGSATGIALGKLLDILDASGCALDVYPLEGTEASGLTFDSAEVPSSMSVYDPSDEYPLDETLFDPNQGVAI